MISIITKVWTAINAIDVDSVLPVVDPGDGFIYVLNTSNKELSNLIYTIFDEKTRFPESSWQVRFGSQHTIQQVIYDPMPMRSELKRIVDTEIPGMAREEFNPMILPGIMPIYPTSQDNPNI